MFGVRKDLWLKTDFDFYPDWSPIAYCLMHMLTIKDRVPTDFNFYTDWSPIAYCLMHMFTIKDRVHVMHGWSKTNT